MLAISTTFSDKVFKMRGHATDATYPFKLAQTSRSAGRLDLLQSLRRVAKLWQAHVHLVHHREVEPAHLTLGLVLVVEHAAAFDASTGASEQHNRQLSCVVIARQHRGAE